jgi:hypothetical protein
MNLFIKNGFYKFRALNIYVQKLLCTLVVWSFSCLIFKNRVHVILEILYDYCNISHFFFRQFDNLFILLCISFMITYILEKYQQYRIKNLKKLTDVQRESIRLQLIYSEIWYKRAQYPILGLSFVGIISTFLFNYIPNYKTEILHLNFVLSLALLVLTFFFLFSVKKRDFELAYELTSGIKIMPTKQSRESMLIQILKFKNIIEFVRGLPNIIHGGPRVNNVYNTTNVNLNTGSEIERSLTKSLNVITVITSSSMFILMLDKNYRIDPQVKDLEETVQQLKVDKALSDNRVEILSDSNKELKSELKAAEINTAKVVKELEAELNKHWYKR